MKRINVRCPYCGARASLRPAAALGKTAQGYEGKRFYVCTRYPFCDAYVEAHARSAMPMGTLANKQLRWKRRAAHDAMARLWELGLMSKAEAYRWLQLQFGIPAEEAHIGRFSDYRCDEVVRICEELINRQIAA